MNWYQFMTLLTDASTDLFSENWTEGNLYAIQGIVDKLSSLAVWVISVVGFGIVIFSILKNALSGLYVVNPNFWDNVDKVKTQAVSTATSGIDGITQRSGNVAAQKLGGFFTFLLSMIPNVRALTDFEDGADVDKKQYFMHSIPLLVAQIFIGMLIFFGYPSKIANWLGTGATYAISAVLNNVDPVETVKKVSESFYTINLATDGSQDPLEQKVNTMAHDAIDAIGSRYTDISNDNLQNIALVVEQDLLNAFAGNSSTGNNFDSVLGVDEGYSTSISVAMYSQQPTVSASYSDVGGVKMALASNGTVTYRYWISINELFSGNSGYTTEDFTEDYCVFQVQAQPVAVSDISTANLIVFGGVSNTLTVNGTSAMLTVKGFTVGNADTDIKASMGKALTAYIVDAATGVDVASLSVTINTASVSTTNGATPILSFGASQRETLKSYLTDAYYIRIPLGDGWTKTVKSSTGNTQTTVTVSELRLKTDVTKVQYALASWTSTDPIWSECGKVDTLTTNTFNQSAASTTDSNQTSN